MRHVIGSCIVLMLLCLSHAALAAPVSTEQFLVRYGAWAAYLMGEEVSLPDVTYDVESGYLEMGNVAVSARDHTVESVEVVSRDGTEDEMIVMVSVLGALGRNPVSEDASLEELSFLKAAADETVRLGDYAVTLGTEEGALYLIAVLDSKEVLAEEVTEGRTDQPLAEAPITSMQAIVDTGGGTLRLREGESVRTKILAELPNGSCVTILDYGEEWCHVIAGGKTGYVMTGFLRVD